MRLKKPGRLWLSRVVTHLSGSRSNAAAARAGGDLAEMPLGLELDQFLEDERLQEQLVGRGQRKVLRGFKRKGPSKKRNWAQKSQLLQKPLRVDLALENHSKNPAPKDILAHQVPVAKKLRRKEELWEKLTKQGELPRDVHKTQVWLLSSPAPKTKPGPRTSLTLVSAALL